MIEDLYKSCRWCHWYVDGECQHKKVKNKADEVNAVTKQIEDGRIVEAVEDLLPEFRPKALEALLRDFNISLRRRNEILSEVDKYFDYDYKPLLLEAVDDAVMAVLGNDDESTSFKPKNPEEFCCKYYE